jgi:CBS domain containing-hemolysin-like protein
VLARLSVIVVLLILNGYFVAVEFALVRARRSRLQAMVRAGDPVARFALAASGNLARVLSASQIGITLASLALGWVAEDTLGGYVASFLDMLPFAVEASLRVTVGAGVALLSVTYLHVVFGELAPRSAALTHPETFAKWLAPPLLAFAWLMTPFITVLNRSAAFVLALFGQKLGDTHEAVHSPDELRILVEQSEEKGALHSQDAELIGKVFEFSEKNAREVMTPRTNIVAIPASANLETALKIVRDGGFSRYPVYEDTVDNVVGMIHARDLLWAVVDDRASFDLRAIARKVHVVPGTREVEDVLADFKRRKEHLAIVLDEFGGTAGLVTMEDLLEEIVGEIRDEFDETIELAVPRAAPGEVLVAGSSAISDVNAQYNLTVPDEDYTTIGGFVFGAVGRLPLPGDKVEGGGATWVVRTMTGRRVETLALEKNNKNEATGHR